MRLKQKHMFDTCVCAYATGRLQRTVKTDSTEHTEATMKLSYFVVATNTETAPITSLQIQTFATSNTDAPPRDCWTQRWRPSDSPADQRVHSRARPTLALRNYRANGMEPRAKSAGALAQS